MASQYPPNGVATSPTTNGHYRSLRGQQSDAGSDNGRNAGNGPAYKRASRKGAPKRFPCSYSGCDKVYSRAEHLQRHQLNHAPKEIYRCDVPGCNLKFVRADLLSRHKKRHSASYAPRLRAPSFVDPDSTENATLSSATGPSQDQSQPHHATATEYSPRSHHQQQPQQNHHSRPYPNHQPTGGPHDAAILLTPETHHAPRPPAHVQPPQPSAPDTTASAGIPDVQSPQAARVQHQPQPQQHAAWPAPPVDVGMDLNASRSKPAPNFYGRDPAPMNETPAMLPFGDVGFQSDAQLSDNFAMWLFDAQAGFNGFGPLTDIPFLEGGLESTFNTNIHYDYESLASRSQLDPTPPRHNELSDDLLSDHRRLEILRCVEVYYQKQPSFVSPVTSSGRGPPRGLPDMSAEMLQSCLHEYWRVVSPRLPIVHKPTFSCNRCPLHLLMVMISLGAMSLRARDSTGSIEEYARFADVIILGIRWEIFTTEDAGPPADLWVVQALLLLEFYEKMYSTRKLHERAHIYHGSFLTLLRRGSPLIGRAGSETPPEEQVPPSFDGGGGAGGLDFRTWWARWAATESMQRVVFAAFMMDTIHAAMFGHIADMTADEIRLPLPCDDDLWNAPTPDSFRHVDTHHRAYGLKQVFFLDGLKSVAHGNAVKTHSFGRMILMSGLLSVGWHLSHRESHLKWLDRGNISSDRDNWRNTLFKAFDAWKEDFDRDLGSVDSPDGSGFANGPIHSASALYHLAHFSLHVDIINCQVYAGMRRLVGRKVSRRDHANAVSRLRVWATLASTRHAVLHAFKLLHRVLLGGKSTGQKTASPPYHYSCRNEPDPHRPWILYYAALSIWSFSQALAANDPNRSSRPRQYTPLEPYLTRVANLRQLDDETARGLGDGLPELLQVLQSSLQECNSELMMEACERLKACQEILAGRAV